jgi:hypothetical protein
MCLFTASTHTCVLRARFSIECEGFFLFVVISSLTSYEKSALDESHASPHLTAPRAVGVTTRYHKNADIGS